MQDGVNIECAGRAFAEADAVVADSQAQIVVFRYVCGLSFYDLQILNGLVLKWATR